MMFDLKMEDLMPQPVLSIRMRTTMESLPKVIGEGYGRILSYLTELGEQPQYAPSTAYYNMDMQDLDVEMGFPVAKLLPGRDGIESRQLLQGRAATCMYQGPYSKMEEPYKEIMNWIAENGTEPTGVFYEYYFNSPAEVPESQLLTRIVIPLK